MLTTLPSLYAIWLTLAACSASSKPFDDATRSLLFFKDCLLLHWRWVSMFITLRIGASSAQHVYWGVIIRESLPQGTTGWTKHHNLQLMREEHVSETAWPEDFPATFRRKILVEECEEHPLALEYSNNTGTWRKWQLAKRDLIRKIKWVHSSN